MTSVNDMIEYDTMVGLTEKQCDQKEDSMPTTRDKRVSRLNSMFDES